MSFDSFLPDQKKYVLTLAVTIAKVDGIVTSDEENFIDEIKSLMGLNQISIDDLLNDVKASHETYCGI